MKRALFAGVAVAFLICLGPIFNPDLPWHVAVGRHIVSSRSIPKTDFLSWTQAGRPWIDFEWAAQIIFYGLDRAGGTTALWLFKAAGYGALVLMLVALLRLWKLPDSWSAIAAPVFVAALIPFLDIRPEIFSMLFVMAQLYVLEKKRLGLLRWGDGPLFVAHFVLYAFWVNLHAGFPMGLALCAIYGAAGKARAPLAWAAAGGLGTLCNPHGIKLYAIFLDHWRHLGILRHLIVEWSEPNFVNAYQNGYWLLFLFACAGFLLAVVRGVGLPLEHLAVVVIFGLMSSRHFRTTAYSIALVFPLSLPAWRSLAAPPWWPKAKPWALAAGLALMAHGTVGALRDMGFLRRIRVLEGLTPGRACVFLRAQKPVLSGLRLYNPWNWGGYLDDVLYPDYKVFMDGRYIFTDLLAEVDAAQEHPGRWKRLMDEKGVELALIENNGHVIRYRNIINWRAFEAYGMPRKDWALVYWDSEAMILVRRSKVPAEWLKRHEFRLLRPHDLRHLGLTVVSGGVSLEDVSAEISRYAREIGDPREVLLLTSWFSEFKKGLRK